MSLNLNVVMLNVLNKSFMFSVIMLNVVMFKAVMECRGANPNTLAYLSGASVTERKGFMRLSPRPIVIKNYSHKLRMFEIS